MHGLEIEIGQRIYAVPWYSGTYLTMQKTCNLVLYNSSGTALWNTNTDITDSDNFTRPEDDSTLDGMAPTPKNPTVFGGCYAIMEANGNLALIAPNCGPPCRRTITTAATTRTSPTSSGARGPQRRLS